MTIVERYRREVVEMAKVESRIAVRNGWCDKEIPYGFKMSWLRLLQALRDSKAKPHRRGAKK